MSELPVFNSSNSAVVRQIIDLIGESDALLLFEEFGGLRLYIPNVRPEASNLCSVITQEAVEKLTQEWGGNYIKLPLAREFMAVRYLSEGRSVRYIAKRLGLTESGVNRMFQRIRKTVSSNA